MKMEDKTAAYLFGLFFEEMAKHSHLPGIKKSALKLYEESLDYDFNDDDMEADAAMMKLGLAERRGIDYGTIIEYGPTQELINELKPPVTVVPDPLLKCG